jgi:hypothetical protein
MPLLGRAYLHVTSMLLWSRDAICDTENKGYISLMCNRDSSYCCVSKGVGMSRAREFRRREGKAGRYE